MPRFETLVLDLDGTLIDSVPDLTDAVNAVLASNDLAPVTERDARGFVGEGAQRLVERALQFRGQAFDQTSIKNDMTIFRTAYRACCTRKTYLYDGVTETLQSLAQAGHRLALCTNKPTEPSMQILHALGIDHLFASFVCGDTFAVRKPDPLCVVEAIARAGGSTAAAVMIGDSRHDVEAARAARVPVIAVDYGYTDIPPRELGADALIAHFAELPETLLKLSR